MKPAYRRQILLLAMAALLASGACGCAKTNDSTDNAKQEAAESIAAEPAAPEISTEAMQKNPAESETKPEETEIETESENRPEETETETLAEIRETESETASEAKASGRLIAIDAGHQAKGNSETEPIGPGASEQKAKVSSGTRGISSGLAEYELTLQVALKLKDELAARGYDVLMIRESHDVNISNARRAQTANEAGADAFIRIHANGSENSSTNGAMTICQTSANPYNASFYSQSKSLASHVLDQLVSATGCQKQYIWETDTMTGINWCQTPATIVEMGYMTNQAEDLNMANADYQAKIASGIANGIDAYFNSQ